MKVTVYYATGEKEDIYDVSESNSSTKNNWKQYFRCEKDGSMTTFCFSVFCVKKIEESMDRR